MTDRPNILFIFTDQQRPDWLGSHADIPVRTPHLDALAARGVHLTNAVCPSPVCAPTRACITAGNEYDRCGVLGNNTLYPSRQPPYQRRLRDEAGYHVMGCGKFHTGRSGSDGYFDWGLKGDERCEEWGFSSARFNAGKNQAVLLARSAGQPRDRYMAYLQQKGLMQIHIDDYARRFADDVWTATFATTLPDEAYFDNWITRNGLALLEEAPEDQPWYLEVNYQNPHHPWDITERMHALYRNPDVDFPPPEHCDLDTTPTEHAQVRRNYAAMIEHLDECVGQLLAKLSARGELERTLIVFSSDHGEQLGDYGQWQKLTPLQASLGVPFIAAGPGVMAQAANPALVSLIDLHATFLECAGLDVPNDIDSRSLTHLLSGGHQTHRRVVYSDLSAWRLAYDGRYKYIVGYDPQKRHGDQFEKMAVSAQETLRLQAERPAILFDTQRDEYTNIIDDEADITGYLRANLEADILSQIQHRTQK